MRKIDVIIEEIGISLILLVFIMVISLMLTENSDYQALKIASALIITGLIAGLVGYRMGSEKYK